MSNILARKKSMHLIPPDIIQPNHHAFRNTFFWVENEAKIFISIRLATIIAISQSALFQEIYLESRDILNQMYNFEYDYYRTNKKIFGNSIEVFRKNMAKDIYQIIKDETYCIDKNIVQHSQNNRHHIFPLMRKSWGIPISQWELKMYYYYKKYNRSYLPQLEKIKLFMSNAKSGMIVGNDNIKNIITMSEQRHNNGINKFFHEWSVLLPHQIGMILWDQNNNHIISQIDKQTKIIKKIEKYLLLKPIDELYHHDVYNIFT